MKNSKTILIEMLIIILIIFGFMFAAYKGVVAADKKCSKNTNTMHEYRSCMNI